MFVLRYSLDIHGDLRRGWSAWAWGRDDGLKELLTYYLGVDIVEERLEKWGDSSWRPWHHRDKRDYNAALLDLAEEHGWDVRQDPATREWCLVHHDGLSAFALEAESIEEAVEEAHRFIEEFDGDWSRGVATVGEVRVVADIGDGWWILECDDIVGE